MKSLVPFFLFLSGPLAANAAGLAGYPVADTLRVGNAAGRLDPAFSQRIEAPVAATVRVRFSGAEATLSAGSVWADVDAERMGLEKRRLEIAKRAVSRREGNDADAGLQLADVESRIRSLDAALSALMTSDDSPLDSVEGGEALKKRLRERNAEAKSALSRERELLKAKLVSMTAERSDELASQKTEIELRELDAKRIEAASILTMPCDGKVTLSVPARKDGTYRVNSGDCLAVIEDKSRFVVRIPATAGFWRTLPASGLTVTVRTGSGSFVTGRWRTVETIKWMGRDERAYAFDVDSESRDSAASFSGGAVVAEVSYRLPRSAHIVNKLRLAAEYPDAFAGGADWRAAVARVWPKSKVLAEGVSELAVEE